MILAPELVNQLNIELQKIPHAADLSRLALMELSEKVQIPRAQLYLREGVMRRVDLIRHCVKRIFEIHPPTRETLLSRSELDDLTTYLQTFAGHVYGVMDNLAWVCALLAGENITTSNRMKIGLFKPETKKFLPPLLNEYLSDGRTKEWFDKYAKAYRDSTAHRIPVYVPPKMLNPVEAEEFNILERRSIEALISMDVDLHERLYAEKEKLGGPANIMLLTPSDEEDRTPEIQFHPQVICDWLTVHGLMEKFIAGICQQYGFVLRKLPVGAEIGDNTGRVVGKNMEIIVKTPQECSPVELEEFKQMVLKGDEVSAGTLDALVLRAHALAFVRDDMMVAVGGLKRPNASYRTKVFAKAQVADAEQFSLEIGWIYVDPRYRGRGLSSTIVRELMEHAEDFGVYATSSMGNHHMHSSLMAAGFSLAGRPYDSEQRDLNIVLFLNEGSES